MDHSHLESREAPAARPGWAGTCQPSSFVVILTLPKALCATCISTIAKVPSSPLYLTRGGR